jgi:hypothetical protein
MPILFVGDLGDGTYGALKADQAKANLIKKLGWGGKHKLFESNLTTALNKIYGGQYTSCGGYKSKGADIQHASSGAGSDGCTLFFALRPGGKPNESFIAVLAIGYHVGAQTYEFHNMFHSHDLPNGGTTTKKRVARWGKWDTDPGSKITLDK